MKNNIVRKCVAVKNRAPRPLLPPHRRSGREKPSIKHLSQFQGEQYRIDPNTLYHWKRELLEEREGAFPGKGHLSPLEEENRKLRRELAEAKEDREILKKALAYFSKHGK
ncbi:MAG: hypothetical protein HBSIN02_25260 [Bacteroidia bacterium]|nr:MAG: hypothetical protein HBSIN02_25260 [Bacteroidia bacterium]